MNTEIELKFLVSAALVAQLPNLLSRYNIRQHDQNTLSNTYFDTPNLALGNLKAGLRIRGKNGHLEQTLKLAGSQVGGLHHRPEYNVDLTRAAPDLSQFPDHIWPPDFALAQVQAQLQPLFSTDFVRERWLVKFKDTEIELAFDVGEVRAGENIAAIQELELELVSGEVSELFTFAEQLLAQGGLRLSAVSKAQRGYLLAVFGAKPQLQSLTLVNNSPLPDSSVWPSLLGQGVEHWQHHEQGWLEAHTSDVSSEQKSAWRAEICAGVDLVAQSVMSLNTSAPTPALAAWNADLAWLQSQLQDASLTDELFYSARYGRLLLQLTHYLYAKGSH